MLSPGSVTSIVPMCQAPSQSHASRLLASTVLLAGCAGPARWSGPGPDAAFKPAERAAAATLMAREGLASIEETVNPVYRIGSGDIVKLEVFGRAEVSGTHTVGPDGRITIPIVGDLFLNDMTREESLELITQRLRRLYTMPVATLSIEQYTSNQITVLGRVERAGTQRFAQAPTLIDVLAGAGAMPILDKQATLTRCAIMRGREQLIWVDLKALLTGDPHYNLRMKKGDIVYIPDSSDTSVYVLGSVPKPGAYRLTPRMTVLDALAQSGGPNQDAAPDRIGVYRAGAREVEQLDFSAVMQPDRARNFALEDGDVIFVPTSKLADFGYLMRQAISPAISVLQFGLSLETIKLQQETTRLQLDTLRTLQTR